MEIKILGTGCPKCNQLEKMVKAVIQDTGVAATVVKVTDLNEIAKEGVLLTPGLVIDDDVKCCGKLPSKEELARMIGEAVNGG